MTPAPNVRIAPTLRATSAAVRALHYLGGEVPNPQACATFVASCYDAASGGFSDIPGGKPDLFTTAVGIMAVMELKMPTEPYAAGVTKYLSENAKGYEDIRIAAAGLERIKAKSPRNAEWLKEIEKLQNADGTFGKGMGQARDTGGSVVILLRLGGKIGKQDVVLDALRRGQRDDGGFAKEDAKESDLETSYRVMRAFMMLKAQPDAARMRDFLAKCRNADGGYGMSPGQPSNVGATYFAAIVEHWLK
jgi:prenyltransferase beta subunit